MTVIATANTNAIVISSNIEAQSLYLLKRSPTGGFSTPAAGSKSMLQQWHKLEPLHHVQHIGEQYSRKQSPHGHHSHGQPLQRQPLQRQPPHGQPPHGQSPQRQPPHGQSPQRQPLHGHHSHRWHLHGWHLHRHHSHGQHSQATSK
ncbi:hypothetical protein BDV3_003941 [Batrachochytrium dendrobatidis]